MANNEWQTPQWIIDLIEKNQGYKFTLDVAAKEHNAKAPEFYTLENSGLTNKWHGHVWCNPPYDDVLPWVEKMLSENNASTTLLINANTDTQYFHKLLQSHASIGFIRRRIKFIDFDGNRNRPVKANLIARTYTSTLKFALSKEDTAYLHAQNLADEISKAIENGIQK